MSNSSAPVIEASASPVMARPTFTITEAAAACAVSRKTITRKLAELADAGAAKDSDGIWRIPVEALLAVGLHPGRSLNVGSARREEVLDLRPAPKAAAPIAPTEPETVTISRDRWDDIRIRLARAEAEAVERGRALDDARLALRALTAGPALSVTVPQAGPSEPAALSPSHPAPEAAPDEEYVPSSGPVPGLPPTPVPHTLAADSSVWDTLLPRTAAATQAATPAVPPATQDPVSAIPAPAPAQTPLLGYPNLGFGSPALGIPAAPGLTGGESTAPARRRWWGGKR